MSKIELTDIYNLILEIGIEKALNQIDIEAIDDLSIKIILRTIQTSHENLFIELRDALGINS